MVAKHKNEDDKDLKKENDAKSFMNAVSFKMAAMIELKKAERIATDCSCQSCAIVAGISTGRAMMLLAASAAEMNKSEALKEMLEALEGIVKRYKLE